jgi:hypothetical protein
MGALIWVEFFCNYDTKVIEYWTILLVKINKIINKNLLGSKGVFGVIGK